MFGLARTGVGYDRLASRLAQPLYAWVAADVGDADLPAGSTVLDVGTGPGRLPLLIAQSHPELRVEGIDLSPEMIDRALSNAAAARIPAAALHYAVADVSHLPQSDGAVDLAVSSLSLHHWADVSAGLAEIRRVLRPGGQALIYDVPRVLRRAEAHAREQGILASVEPLRSAAGHPAGLLGRLVARLRIEG